MSPEEILDQHLWGVHKHQLTHYSIKKEIVNAMQAYSNHVLTKKLEEVEEEMEKEFSIDFLGRRKIFRDDYLKRKGANWLLKTLKEKTIFKQ